MSHELQTYTLLEKHTSNNNQMLTHVARIVVEYNDNPTDEELWQRAKIIATKEDLIKPDDVVLWKGDLAANRKRKYEKLTYYILLPESEEEVTVGGIPLISWAEYLKNFPIRRWPYTNEDAQNLKGRVEKVIANCGISIADVFVDEGDGLIVIPKSKIGSDLDKFVRITNILGPNYTSQVELPFPALEDCWGFCINYND